MTVTEADACPGPAFVLVYEAVFPYVEPQSASVVPLVRCTCVLVRAPTDAGL